MIIILFVGGSFGSTLEYSLRRFSNELKKVEAIVLEDGSMHSYLKEFHPITIDQLSKIKNKEFSVEIATPVYPGWSGLEPLDTIKEMYKFLKDFEKVVVIHLNTPRMAERNQLFTHYKLPNFWLSSVLKDKHKQWNATYTSLNDMRTFEKREALSFYIDTLSSYLKIQENMINGWLYITPDDILYNFKNTILNIINYYDLTVNDSEDIDEFYNHWFSKQQYILDEFETINCITDNINLKGHFKWDPLSITGEAIIQSRLRKQGIELACSNLDIFPTNLKDLKKFIINKK